LVGYRVPNGSSGPSSFVSGDGQLTLSRNADYTAAFTANLAAAAGFHWEGYLSSETVFDPNVAGDRITTVSPEFTLPSEASGAPFPGHLHRDVDRHRQRGRERHPALAFQHGRDHRGRAIACAARRIAGTDAVPSRGRTARGRDPAVPLPVGGEVHDLHALAGQGRPVRRDRRRVLPGQVLPEGEAQGGSPVEAGRPRVLSLRPWLKRPLRAGAVLTVTVTKPAAFGIVKKLVVRRDRGPSITERCLQPGSKTARAACSS
jgi:hypothetical protein